MQKEITAWASSDKSIVATLLDSVNNRYLYSKDGFNWSYRDFSVMANWTDVAWGNNTYIAINTDGVFVRSNDDGLSWTPFGGVVNSSLEMAQYVSYANDKFFISSRPYNFFQPRNKFFYSTNGISWSTGFSPVGANFEKVYYANNRYITFLDSGTNIYLHSTNGTGWNTGILPLRGRWKNLTYDGAKFLAVSEWPLLSLNSRTGITSVDGLNWDTIIMPFNNCRQLDYNKSIRRYAMISENSHLLLSDNGINWVSTGSGLFNSGTNQDRLISFQDKFILKKYPSNFSASNLRLLNMSTLPYNFPFKESGNLYSPLSTWNNGVGNAYIGNWFFVDRAGTFRGIINTNQNGRASIGNSGFFFAPSTGTAAFYVDAYFNLTNPLINGQGISLNANYSWNGGIRGIEFKPGTDGDSTFRIEHGNGDDRIYLRGPSFQDQVISTNGFQQALNYNIVYRQTGMLFEARNYTNNSLIFSTGLPVSQTIRQIHFYIGNIQASPGQQLNYGLAVNNLETHYKQRVPFFSSSSSSFSSSSSSSSSISSSSSSFSSSSSSRSSSSSSNSSSSSLSSSSSSSIVLINNWQLANSITGDFSQYLGVDVKINNSGNILFIGSADTNKSVSIYTGSRNNWSFNKFVTGFGQSNSWAIDVTPTKMAISENGDILVVGDNIKNFINIYTGIYRWDFKQTLTGPSGIIRSVNVSQDASKIVVSEEVVLDALGPYGRIFIYTGNANNGWVLNQYIKNSEDYRDYPDSSIYSNISPDGNVLVSWDDSWRVDAGGQQLTNKKCLVYNFSQSLNTWIKTGELTNRLVVDNVSFSKDGSILSIGGFTGVSYNNRDVYRLYLYTGNMNRWTQKQDFVSLSGNVANNLSSTAVIYNISGTSFIINRKFHNAFPEGIDGTSIFSGSKFNGWSLIQHVGQVTNLSADNNFTTIVQGNPRFNLVPGSIINWNGIVNIYTGNNLFL